MTEKDPIKDDFSEYGRLEKLLKETDLSGKSKVRDSLKNRLISKAAQREARSFFRRAWLAPAAAAALAALALTINITHKRPEAPAYDQAYAIPSDAYGDCGRQGLSDYLSVPRF